MTGAYSVSKTVLFGLTKAVAQDLASDNIRVNCVAPGLVRTNFAKVVRRKHPTSVKCVTFTIFLKIKLYESKEAYAAALDKIPMRRFVFM